MVREAEYFFLFNSSEYNWRRDTATHKSFPFCLTLVNIIREWALDRIQFVPGPALGCAMPKGNGNGDADGPLLFKTQSAADNLEMKSCCMCVLGYYRLPK